MTGLRHVAMVAGREFRERGRSAYFLISSGVMLVIVLAAVVVPSLAHDETAYDVGVIDVSPALAQSLAAVEDPPIEVLPLADLVEGEAALADGRVDAVVAAATDGRHEVLWESEPIPSLSGIIVGAISTEQLGVRAEQLGISADEIAALLAPPAVEHGALEPVDPLDEGRFFVAMVALVLLFMAIVTYGTFVLAGVAEEKGSRVVEVLLARIAPRHLLAGKVAGIGALGLAQLVVIAIAAVVALRVTPNLPGPVPEVSVGTAAWLLVWFVLGYAFYAMAYGALGALASRVEDAQNVSGPLVFIVLGIYFFVFAVVMNDPDGLLSRIAAIVPLSSPFVMPVRSAMGGVPVTESVVALVVMIASIYGLVQAAGRIYEGAILRTGGRVRLREAWRTAA